MKETLIFLGRIKSPDEPRTILKRGCFFDHNIGEDFSMATELVSRHIQDTCGLDVILSRQAGYGSL
jgi:hypothetical protein